MLKFVIISLSLGFVVGSSVHRGGHLDISETLEDHVARGQTTLNEMFREVEKLMEDTQQKLEEAVHQMANESSKSLLHGRNFPASFHNETTTEIKVGNQTVHLIERIDKKNLDLNLQFFKKVVFECTKDVECCGDQLCVWGVCAQNRTKGQSGTICQDQSDCSPQHCCAFHKALLFPVCRPKPQEGQGCHSDPNQLMDLLLWDEEGPQEHCPCATGLHCQPLKNKSVCVDERNATGEENAD
ncbi:hypothetical protein cypCar_00027326 [Cyprinus carpio]|nr:hypothetical protein cypCar_00027326 [Cyprinus carpio]